MAWIKKRRDGIGFTSPRLDQLVYLVSGIHGTEVEKLDDRPGLLEFGGVIRGRGELFKNLAAHAGCGLLLFDHGAVTKVALDKEHHFVVTHKHLIAANVV